ncbi:hypothetical protein INR49_003811 [Caranx melampygus]|nr:hypothetical protein INR49_003811 [Caranx melampygus]
MLERRLQGVANTLGPEVPPDAGRKLRSGAGQGVAEPQLHRITLVGVKCRTTLIDRHHMMELCPSVKTPVNTGSPGISAKSVNTGSLEGCGAPGLEKAPIDGGISQGALFVVTRPVSFILSSFPPTDSPRMTLTPQQSSEDHDMRWAHMSPYSQEGARSI